MELTGLSSLGGELDGMFVSDFALPTSPLNDQYYITALMRKRAKENVGLAFLTSFSLATWLTFLALFSTVVFVDAFKQRSFNVIAIFKRIEFFIRATIGESFCK